MARLVVGGAVAAAQVTFSWPDTTFNVSKYRSLGECRQAVDRISKRAPIGRVDGIREAIGRDTMPVGAEAMARHEAVEVVNAYKACVTHFEDDVRAVVKSPDYGEYSIFWWVMQAYFALGRDSEVVATIDEGLDQLAKTPANSVARKDLMEGAWRLYAWGKPPRRAAQKALLLRAAREASGRNEQLAAYRKLFNFTQTVEGSHQDTAEVMAYAAKIAELSPEPPGRALLGRYRTFNELAFAPYRYLASRALLDTLRQYGTARFVAANEALFTRLAGMSPAQLDEEEPGLRNEHIAGRFRKLFEFHKLVGHKAPEIVGDFWFRRGDSTVARPVPGKVNLLVFVNPTPPGLFAANLQETDSVATPAQYCNPTRNTPEDLEAAYEHRLDELSESCGAIFAVLRRLGQRFPQLEVTVVTQTLGSFVYTAYPNDQAKEAEVIRRWLHDGQRLPGALAVTATSYRYRPGYDPRLTAYFDIPNTDHYFSAIGETWAYLIPIFNMWKPVIPTAAATFLVDREGTVVAALPLSLDAAPFSDIEPRLGGLIDAVLRQSPGSGPKGGPDSLPAPKPSHP